MDEMQKAKIKLSQTMAAADAEARRYEELVSKNQEFSKVVAEKKKTIEKLDKEIEKRKGDTVILADELINLQDKIEVEKKNLSSVTVNIVDKQKELDAVNKEIDMAKSVQADEEASFKDKIDKERVKIKKELDSLESERQGLLDGNKTIADGNVRLEAKKLELDGEIKVKNDELGGIQKTIDNANASVASLNNKIQVSENDYNLLELSKKSLQEEIDTLGKDKKSAEESLKAVNAKLDEMTRYRINLIKKGKDVNRALSQVQELFKTAGINIPINVEPIIVPSEDND